MLRNRTRSVINNSCNYIIDVFEITHMICDFSFLQNVLSYKCFIAKKLIFFIIFVKM